MVERFLRYSLERGRKICVVLMRDGGIKRVNLYVTAIDADSFSARLSGKKQEMRVELADVLTATYARGDKGELE